MQGLINLQRNIWWCDESIRSFYNYCRIPTSQDDVDVVFKMRSAIEAHPIAREIIQDIESPEVSIFYEYQGVAMRSRIDATLKSGAILDLKTTDDASDRAFRRSVFKWRYHVQRFLYKEGYERLLGRKIPEFYFLVVEKKEPFGVGVYTLGKEFVDQARLETNELLKAYEHCLGMNEWPGYNWGQITEIDI